MKIKFFLAAIAAMLLSGAVVSAQTPEEIVQKMSAQLDRCNAEGFSMDFVMKMPIVGTIRTHEQIFGKKMKTSMSNEEKDVVIWYDETTKWTFDSKDNTVTVENRALSSSEAEESDMKAFDRLRDGYGFKLQEETPEAWYILCKKTRSNKDKDAPGTMNLAVDKATFLPLYIRSKKSMFMVSIENVVPGVTEESVTFHPEAYPTAKVIDKR
ncbi:MAG: hypothetical protein J6O01_06075 [Bacteroidales bacterium]|nr:hypothetical protein [Bacteroidales bacterium]